MLLYEAKFKMSTETDKDRAVFPYKAQKRFVRSIIVRWIALWLHLIIKIRVFVKVKMRKAFKTKIFQAWHNSNGA